MLRIIISLLTLLLYSCSNPCCKYPVYGAAEFVTDSYLIRQGKNSILEMEGDWPGDLTSEDMEEYRDEIAEDDVLNVIVYHPTRSDLMDAYNYINASVGGFKVSDGSIDLPDIEPIVVAGFSLDEAKERIQARLHNEIKHIEVFLTYRDRLIKKVELAGMVATPTVPVDGKVRLFEVIAKAKIPPDANLFKSYVLRDDCQLPVDLYKLIHEGDMCQNIVMKGGDKIYIAPAMEANVMMLGEVAKASAIAVSNGFISLREAIVMAGGIPYTGDKRCIQVIRGGLKDPKSYRLAWEHVVHLPNDSLLLMPGDTVYVSTTPLREWNIFIEQLLPSFGGVKTVQGIYNAGN